MISVLCLGRRSTWLIINSDGFKSSIVSDKRGIIEVSLNPMKSGLPLIVLSA